MEQAIRKDRVSTEQPCRPSQWRSRRQQLSVAGCGR